MKNVKDKKLYQVWAWVVTYAGFNSGGKDVSPRPPRTGWHLSQGHKGGPGALPAPAAFPVPGNEITDMLLPGISEWLALLGPSTRLSHTVLKGSGTCLRHRCSRTSGQDFCFAAVALGRERLCYKTTLVLRCTDGRFELRMWVNLTGKEKVLEWETLGIINTRTRGRLWRGGGKDWGVWKTVQEHRDTCCLASGGWAPAAGGRRRNWGLRIGEWRGPAAVNVGSTP